MPVTLLDANGQSVTVDDAEARAGLLAGRYRVGAESVRLVRADGTAGQVRADQLGAALSQTDDEGAPVFGFDTPARQEERRLEAEYGDSPVRAGAAAVARGATLGISDQLASALGGEGTEEALRELRERNEAASAVGEIGGSLLPLLLTRGRSTGATIRPAAGLAARILRGVYTPARRAIEAGEATEAGAAALLRGQGSASLARRVLARGGGLALGGAVEGGLAGVGEVITEDALGQADATAERVLASAGLGSLFGGVTGGALGTGGALFGEGLRAGGRGLLRLAGGAGETIERAWQQSTGRELRPGVGELYARVASLASGADEGAIRRFTDLGAEGRRAREIVTRGDAVIEEGTTRLIDDLAELERASTHVQDFAIGSLKRNPIARAIRTDTIPAQLAAAEGAMARARELAQDILDNPHIYSGVGGVAQGRTLSRNLEGFAGDLATAMRRAADEPGEAAADIYITLDRMKRSIGQLRDRTRDTTTIRALDELYEREFRPLLEQEDLWGATVTSLQRETNAAWSSYLTRRRDFQSMFLREMDRDLAADAVEGALTSGFRGLSRGDSAKVGSFLRAVGSADNITREEIFRSTLAAQRELNEAIIKHFDVPEAVARQAIEARGTLARVQSTLDEVTESAETLNQFRQLQSGGIERSLIGTTVGAVAGGTLGLFSSDGDGIGGTVGAAAGALLASPGQAVRVLSVLDRLQGQTNERIAASVRGFLGRGAEGVADAARGAARTATRVAKRAPVVTVRAYEEKIRELREATTDPTVMTRQIGDRTAGLSEDAPNVQRHMQATAARAASYLVTQIPATNRHASARLLPETRQRPPSRSQMDRFMRVARAVEEPLSILDDLEAGRLHRASVDAMKAVYPQLYAQIVSEVMRQLHEGKSEPSYRHRLALGTLLGAPTDPSLRPQFLATIQRIHAAHAGGPAQQQPSAAPTRDAPDVAGQLVSESQRIAARGGG